MAPEVPAGPVPPTMAAASPDANTEASASGALAGVVRGLTRVVGHVGRGSIAGTFAGMAEETAGYPLDIVKTRMQVATTPISAVSVFRNIIKHEGWSGVFRGLSPPLAASAFVNGVLFGVFSNVEDRLEGTPGISDNVSPFISGAFAGLAQSVITCPIDVVKNRLQVMGLGHGAAAHGQGDHANVGPMTVARSLVRQSGLGSLYLGYTATLLRDVPGYAVFFGVYEGLKVMMGKFAAKELNKIHDFTETHGGHPVDHRHKPSSAELHHSANPVLVILAGGVAGMAYHASTYPFDVAKTMIQISPVGEYKGVLDCMRTLAARHGTGALLKGFVPTVVRAFPANAVGFLVYEATMKFLPA